MLFVMRGRRNIFTALKNKGLGNYFLTADVMAYFSF